MTKSPSKSRYGDRLFKAAEDLPRVIRLLESTAIAIATARAERSEQMREGANLRSVWWIPPAQCRENHFAVMPERVAEICILAGSRPGDLVLDPFSGSGTTGQVAQKWGRRYCGVELNADYIELSKERFRQNVLFPATA